jgi:hypothetical protein
MGKLRNNSKLKNKKTAFGCGFFLELKAYPYGVFDKDPSFS